MALASSRRNPLARRVIRWACLGGAALLLVALEHHRPLRRRVEPWTAHVLRNAGVAATAWVTVSLTEGRLLRPLLRERGRLPLWAQVALMDYTLYLWHVLTHRVPLLWRFHLVHHVDRDLDASTALRFHFGELLLSVPWRAMQIRALGVSVEGFRVWQALTTASILFHHSNLRLPLAVERWLSWLVVTPRLHGIHHSTLREETDSNWSSGLALWDWLHGTRRVDVPQCGIVIGVPAWGTVPLPRLMLMPFQEQRDDWRLPESG